MEYCCSTAISEQIRIWCISVFVARRDTRGIALLCGDLHCAEVFNETLVKQSQEGVVFICALSSSFTFFFVD